METVQCWLSRSSSNGPKRARIKPLTTRTPSGKAIATYAYDQIDQARIELNAISK